MIRILIYLLIALTFWSCRQDRDETTMKGQIISLCASEPYSNKLVKVVTFTRKGVLFNVRENEVVESEFYTDDLGKFVHTFDPITSANSVQLYTANKKLIASNSFNSAINFSTLYKFEDFNYTLSAIPSQRYTASDRLIIRQPNNFNRIYADTIFGPFDSTIILTYPFVLPNNLNSDNSFGNEFSKTNEFDIHYELEFKRDSLFSESTDTLKIINCEAFNNFFTF